MLEALARVFRLDATATLYLLADLLDPETHARHGRLIVVQVDEQIKAFAAFHRAPQFDADLAASYAGPGAAPITSFAYLRNLTPMPAWR